MIQLFSFGESFGVKDPSPFVLKVDAFMRICNIEFEHISNLANLQKAPKGKLPFIQDSNKTIADSEFIVQYLIQRYHLTIDEHLTDEEKILSYFIGRTLEESFYWCLVYSRWEHEATWQKIKQAFFSKLPFPIKLIAPKAARKDVKKALRYQGIGRHSEDEILTIAKNTLDMLQQQIDKKPYCFGDRISSIDATIYAFLAQVIIADLGSPLNNLAKKYHNLINYCQAIHKKYYN